MVELVETTGEYDAQRKGRCTKTMEESGAESNDEGSIRLMRTDLLRQRQQQQQQQLDEQKRREQRQQQQCHQQLSYEEHGSEEGGNAVGGLEAGQREIENGAVEEASSDEPVAIFASLERENAIDTVYDAGVHSFDLASQDFVVRER